MTLTAFCLAPNFVVGHRRKSHSGVRLTASASKKDKQDSPSPPTTIESTISQASAALSRATSAGEKRLRVSALIPGLNPLVEDAYPYSTAALNQLARGIVLDTPQLEAAPSCSLLFQSSGAAALASRQYSREDSLSEPHTTAQGQSSVEISTASYAIRDTSLNRSSPDTNVIVAPTSARGESIMDALESVIADDPSATWILLNPDLTLDRASVGMGESTRRATFLQSFTEAFYFRNIVSLQCRVPLQEQYSVFKL